MQVPDPPGSGKGKTNEDSKEVQTETLELTATPFPDGLVKVKTGANTTDEAITTGILRYIRLSIYQVLPEIIEIWGLNVQTQVESKIFERLTGK